MEDQRVARDGHVLAITLDRPCALNALTIGMTGGLLEVLGRTPVAQEDLMTGDRRHARSGPR